MLLTDILTEDRIKVPLASTAKDAIIAELVDTLVAGGAVSDREKALQAVMERERTRTTGIGNGLAVPHGKSPAVSDLVMAIGRPAQPVDFASIDSKPVSLVVMLISPPDRTGPHIQALAHISRLLSIDAFRKKLLEAKDAHAMFEAIREHESS